LALALLPHECGSLSARMVLAASISTNSFQGKRSYRLKLKPYTLSGTTFPPPGGTSISPCPHIPPLNPNQRWSLALQIPVPSVTHALHVLLFRFVFPCCLEYRNPFPPLCGPFAEKWWTSGLSRIPGYPFRPRESLPLFKCLVFPDSRPHLSPLPHRGRNPIWFKKIRRDFRKSNPFFPVCFGGL